jgi:hypothetical protein
VLGVVLGELQIPALPGRSRDDVADPTPRVEAAVQQPKLRLARLEREKIDGAPAWRDDR